MGQGEAQAAGARSMSQLEPEFDRAEVRVKAEESSKCNVKLSTAPIVVVVEAKFNVQQFTLSTFIIVCCTAMQKKKCHRI